MLLWTHLFPEDGVHLKNGGGYLEVEADVSGWKKKVEEIC